MHVGEVDLGHSSHNLTWNFGMQPPYLYSSSLRRLFFFFSETH